MILFQNFQGFTLFSYQGSLAAAFNTQLWYLTTLSLLCQYLFWYFFQNFFLSSAVELYYIILPLSCQHLEGAKKISFEKKTEKEGFEPSRRYSRPTPLAGAPLQPLEYFSWSSIFQTIFFSAPLMTQKLLYSTFTRLSTDFFLFFYFLADAGKTHSASHCIPSPAPPFPPLPDG